MSRRSDQKELLDVLSDYVNKMSREDYDLYSMFLKRHKEDEDFDNISFGKLQKLHTKYYVKKDIKDLMKKYGFNTDK